jgi:hypothetical protein
MLKKMLRSVFSVARGAGRDPLSELPHERQLRLASAHHRAPRDAHARILFSDLRMGSGTFTEFTEACARDSASMIPPLKALHRVLASYFLARYFLHTLDLAGARAECGVYNGMSALLMCRAARTRRPEYDGAGLYLIDSFQGLSRPEREDYVEIRTAAGAKDNGAVYPEGSLATPVDNVRKALQEFPGVSIHPGWIPDVFATLPETPWCFAHLDVDLYAPTRAGLEYFYPRLVEGGVIICDDYGAPLFPGAHRAWDEFCAEHDVPFVVLDTGQSVIMKAAKPD